MDYLSSVYVISGWTVGKYCIEKHRCGAHICQLTHFVICFRSVSSLKAKKSHHGMSQCSTVHTGVANWSTSCNKINKNSQRGVSLIWPSSDLSRRTEGVATFLRRGLTGFLYRRRRGHQSCLARKEPIPQRTAPAASSLHPTSATILLAIKVMGEALKSVLLKAHQR